MRYKNDKGYIDFTEEQYLSIVDKLKCTPFDYSPKQIYALTRFLEATLNIKNILQHTSNNEFLTFCKLKISQIPYQLFDDIWNGLSNKEICKCIE